MNYPINCFDYSPTEIYHLFVLRIQQLYLEHQDQPDAFYEKCWLTYHTNCKYFKSLANDPRVYQVMEQWDLLPEDNQIQHRRYIDSKERSQYIESRKKRFWMISNE